MTSDRSALKARLQPSLVQDFDGLWEAWVAESGSEDLGHFVSHLLEWKLIPAEVGEPLLPNLEIEEDPTDLEPLLAEPPSEDLSEHLAVLVDAEDAQEPEPEPESEPEAYASAPVTPVSDPDRAPGGFADRAARGWYTDASPDPSPFEPEALEATIVAPPLVDSGLPTYDDDEDAATALMVRPTPDSLASRGREETPVATTVSRDPDLGRRLAVKTLADSASPAERLRFVREALVAAQLDHPGVPAVLEIRSPQVYVSRSADGATLRQVLDEVRSALAAGHGVPVERALPALLDRFVSVCETIAYASARGLVHGGLHPGAVLIGGHGATYVTDWGLARVFSRDVPDPIDLANNTDDDPGDARTDVYALGTILYEILTLRAHEEGTADWSHRYGQPIDPALRAVAATALDPRPSERFAHAGALGGAVRRARAAAAPVAEPAPPADAPETPSNGPWYVAIGLAVGWLLTLLAWAVTAT